MDTNLLFTFITAINAAAAAQKASTEASIWPALVPSIIAVLSGVAIWLKAAAVERKTESAEKKSEAAAASADKAEKIATSNTVTLDKVLVDVNSGSSAMKEEIKELRSTVLKLSEGKATSDEQLKRMHAAVDAERIIKERSSTSNPEYAHAARVERAAEKTEAAAEDVTEAAEKTETAISKLTDSEVSKMIAELSAEMASRKKK